jgi:hypothetical protein
MPAAITMPMTTATEAMTRGSPSAPAMSSPVTLLKSAKLPGR